MAKFYGQQSVKRSLKMMRRTGKVTSGTLKVRTSGDTTTDVTYANCYVPPVQKYSGMGEGGAPHERVQITLWQVGEATAPAEDHLFTDSNSRNWFISEVDTALNADSGYAVHHLTCWRYSS